MYLDAHVSGAWFILDGLCVVRVVPAMVHTQDSGEGVMAKRPFNFDKLTDEDLDRLSEITEQDIAATHQTIVQSVSKRFRNLALATRERLFNE